MYDDEEKEFGEEDAGDGEENLDELGMRIEGEDEDENPGALPDEEDEDEDLI